MTKGERFRLSKNTLGAMLEDGKITGTTIIPRKAVIEIVSGVEEPQRMVEVDWHGQRVLLFIEDVQERGKLVDGHAEAFGA